jgi:hypothetical protein
MRGPPECKPIFLLQYHYYYTAGARRNQEFPGPVDSLRRMASVLVFWPISGMNRLSEFLGIDFPKDLPYSPTCYISKWGLNPSMDLRRAERGRHVAYTFAAVAGGAREASSRLSTKVD